MEKGPPEMSFCDSPPEMEKRHTSPYQKEIWWQPMTGGRVLGGLPQISSFRESKTDDRRFYIFCPTKTLHLRTDLSIDRVAWIQALILATKETSIYRGISFMQNDVSISTEKLRDRMQAEGLDKSLIEDCERIMNSEFSEYHRQLKLRYEEHLNSISTFHQQLEFTVVIQSTLMRWALSAGGEAARRPGASPLQRALRARRRAGRAGLAPKGKPTDRKPGDQLEPLEPPRLPPPPPLCRRYPAAASAIIPPPSPPFVSRYRCRRCWALPPDAMPPEISDADVALRRNLSKTY
ncbi:oxysterol-binding protein [Musa troglodytarum]|uniref:Oxysterol-binding protein n=1 Tax=Musa troglodytarum TaxID=320322 RepID=A0A9E7FWL3_9LILI|nr:oxysterol-binding protein [Musa troglodytarum]